jgi:hypothetical protein
MTRVLLVSLDEGEVVARCLAANVSISAIERLPSGGTRFVCASVDGAKYMRKKLKSQILPGTVARASYRPGMPPL